MTRNISIQVLRGISVLAVVLFHSFPSIFKTGYFGVDLFFIISGFVITPLLNNIIASKSKISELKIFYLKRYWRLIPSLSVTLIATLVIGFFFSGIGYLNNLFYSALSTQFIVANYFSYRTIGDYFRPNPQPLLHTWSLSVEEQIYLLLPIILLLSTKLFKNLFKMSHYYSIFGSVSFVMDIYDWPKNDIFSFYSFHSRVWQFSLGALIYFLNSKRLTKRRTSSKTSTLLLLLVCLLLLFGPQNFIYIALLILLFSDLFFFELDKALPISIVRPLAILGDKSYSLYLVHMPIIWLISQISNLFTYSYAQQTICKILGIPIIYLIGNKLYLSIEVKYRNKEFRVESKRKVFMKMQLFLISITIVGIAAANNNYFLTNSVLNRPITEMDQPVTDNCNVMTSETACQFTSNENNKQYLLIGDSHAGAVWRTINETIALKGSLDVFLKTGCQFIDSRVTSEFQFNQSSDCQLYIDKVKQYIQSKKYNGIMIAYISSVDKATLGNNSYSTFLDQKLTSIRKIQSLCDCKVLIIGPTPLFPRDSNFFSPNRRIIQGNENPLQEVKISEMDQSPFKENIFWTNKLFKDENIFMINTIEEFCGLHVCSRWSNGWLFADYSHLSSLGARYLKSKFSEGIDKAKL